MRAMTTKAITVRGALARGSGVSTALNICVSVRSSVCLSISKSDQASPPLDPPPSHIRSHKQTEFCLSVSLTVSPSLPPSLPPSQSRPELAHTEAREHESTRTAPACVCLQIHIITSNHKLHEPTHTATAVLPPGESAIKEFEPETRSWFRPGRRPGREAT